MGSGELDDDRAIYHMLTKRVVVCRGVPGT